MAIEKVSNRVIYIRSVELNANVVIKLEGLLCCGERGLFSAGLSLMCSKSAFQEETLLITAAARYFPPPALLLLQSKQAKEQIVQREPIYNTHDIPGHWRHLGLQTC